MPISSHLTLTNFEALCSLNSPFKIETAINVAPKLIQLEYDTNHLDYN